MSVGEWDASGVFERSRLDICDEMVDDAGMARSILMDAWKSKPGDQSWQGVLLSCSSTSTYTATWIALRRVIAARNVAGMYKVDVNIAGRLMLMILIPT